MSLAQPDLFTDRLPDLQPGVWQLCQDVMNNADDEHSLVLRFLLDAVAAGGDEKARLRTQSDIADAVPSLGAHRHETDATPTLKHKRDTTLRKVRQIVRDLRVQYGVPILSSPRGYWLPRCADEVDAYVERVERQARATAASWFETYRAVRPFASRRGATLELFSSKMEEAQ